MTLSSIWLGLSFSVCCTLFVPGELGICTGALFVCETSGRRHGTARVVVLFFFLSYLWLCVGYVCEADRFIFDDCASMLVKVARTVCRGTYV
jgi:hypothetical protein